MGQVRHTRRTGVLRAVTRDLGLLAGITGVPRVPGVEDFLWAGQILIWFFRDTCRAENGCSWLGLTQRTNCG